MDRRAGSMTLIPGKFTSFCSFIIVIIIIIIIIIIIVIIIIINSSQIEN